jgi:hypothetical protein
MKNVLFNTALLLMIPSMCPGGIKAEEQIIPGLKLRIDNEHHLTDKNGLVLPAQVINVTVGKLVAIYRTDGFCYHGQVTEIEEGPDFYKVFGKVLNSEDTGFGFAINKGGYFSGAIRDRKDNVTYVLEFNPIHKGFIFVRSYKHDSPSAKNKTNKEEYQTINNILEWLLNTKI